MDDCGGCQFWDGAACLNPASKCYGMDTDDGCDKWDGGQEPIKPEIAGYPDASRSYGSWYYICGSCGAAIDYKDKFCRACGRGVKWDGGQDDDRA